MCEKLVIHKEDNIISTNKPIDIGQALTKSAYRNPNPLGIFIAKGAKIFI